VAAQPDSGGGRLRARATLLAQIRGFFAANDSGEVDTPLLCSSGVTDPAIEPLLVERGDSLKHPRYLQTSPEYAMKRLLAQGSGAIYQIARAFRDGEAGARHNLGNRTAGVVVYIVGKTHGHIGEVVPIEVVGAV